MPYTVLMFVTRRQGMTPYQFKKHFEEVHVPLIYTITGPHFPKHHNRSYIQRIPDNSVNTSKSDNSNAKWPATSLLGPGPEPDFDALAELVFNDWARCKRFFDIIKQEDAHRVLAADEESFMDRGKTKAVVLDEVTGNRNCAQPPLELIVAKPWRDADGKLVKRGELRSSFAFAVVFNDTSRSLLVPH